MRTVDPHLLEDKMDEVVTHYINTHQQSEVIHVDAGSLPLSVHDEGSGRVVTVMHQQQFSSQMCRQVSVSEAVGDGPWNELLEPDARIAALAAHLAQQSRSLHHQMSSHQKITSAQRDVDSSVMLDSPLRMFNVQTLDQQSEPIVVEIPSLQPLPPLQGIKRCQDGDWFKEKTLKENAQILNQNDNTQTVLVDIGPSSSPAQTKQNKKSLPHKKRISRKLKRNNGNCTPQQDIVVINCHEEVQQEEILPDNYVSSVPHQQHLEETHHISTEVRAVFICQLCGDYYGDDQLKFYQHLKQHYEPHDTIIIENPVSDLGIDKMPTTCIVDNVAALPDSIVELSLESTMPKTTIYQPMEKHISYITSSDKTLNYSTNKVQYSMANMDKETNGSHNDVEKEEMYDSLEKVELYRTRSNKSLKKQKYCESHIKETHSKNPQLEEMNEFSEPEDLMEGIHVSVEEGGAHYELPPLGVLHEHGHRHWYNQVSRGGCDGYCPVCPAPPPAQLKEEVFQRIFEEEIEVPSENQNFDTNIIQSTEEIQDMPPEKEESNPERKFEGESVVIRKKGKDFECPHCGRMFKHRNSLLYHVLSHLGKKPHQCGECGKSFYTSGALKVHNRVHNGDKPYKCDECGRNFRQWGDLKYHVISLHTDTKHFKCDFCGKEFSRKYSLSVHRRIHTGEKNYKCEYCNKTFRTSSYRLTHMRTHTGFKPHKCEICEKCFRVAADLRRHILIHEKPKNRSKEYKKKDSIKVKEKKSPTKVEIKVEAIVANSQVDANEEETEIKKEPINQEAGKKVITATSKNPILRSILGEKKSIPSKSKKSSKKGAPNVTVNGNSESVFKNSEHAMNVEVIDTRQGNGHKFKGYDPTPHTYSKVNEQDNTSEVRELVTLKPMFRPNDLSDSDCAKTVFVNRSDSNTDGRMTVFTHVEKTKDVEVPVIAGTQINLGDIRHHIEVREHRTEIPGEAIENGLLDRLSAFYNIPS